MFSICHSICFAQFLKKCINIYAYLVPQLVECGLVYLLDIHVNDPQRAQDVCSL